MNVCKQNDFYLWGEGSLLKTLSSPFLFTSPTHFYHVFYPWKVTLMCLLNSVPCSRSRTLIPLQCLLFHLHWDGSLPVSVIPAGSISSLATFPFHFHLHRLTHSLLISNQTNRGSLEIECTLRCFCILTPAMPSFRKAYTQALTPSISNGYWTSYFWEALSAISCPCFPLITFAYYYMYHFVFLPAGL